MARAGDGDLAFIVDDDVEVLSDCNVSSDAAESIDGRFGAVSTSAGLALILDEADPIIKGKLYRVVTDVLTSGELLDSGSPEGKG